MQKLVSFVLASIFSLNAAYSAVNINGLIEANEYAVVVSDPGPDAIAIPASYDLLAAHVSGGDRLHIGWELLNPYDVDGEDNDNENFVRMSLDVNNDNTIDFRVRIDNNSTGTVYRGATGFTNIAGTFSTFAFSDDVEASVPWALFTPDGVSPSVFASSGQYTIQARWRVDGGGDSADDSIPTSSTFSSVTFTVVPEPASFALLAGLLVALSLVRRRDGR